jgi:hypothetical protein
MGMEVLGVMAALELRLPSLVHRLHMLVVVGEALTPASPLALEVRVVVEMEPQTMF